MFSLSVCVCVWALWLLQLPDMHIWLNGNSKIAHRLLVSMSALCPLSSHTPIPAQMGESNQVASTADGWMDVS